MCGITGLVALPPAPLASAVTAMTRLVRHRGPDDEGYALFAAGGARVIGGGEDTPASCYAYDAPYAPKTRLDSAAQPAVLALGHRRLSILDVSAAGHQPMCCPEGRFWIVYNGEIYNYLELRAELAALGYAFHTGTDTEVILAAYRHWGRDCLHRFNGMFAFLLYDVKTSRLFAARDRFGVKPLYYWRSPSGLLAFASEIKQFTAIQHWEARMNPQRCYDFLNWSLLDHTSETLFRGVYQVRNGEALELDLSSRLPDSGPLPALLWYTLSPTTFDGDFNSAAERFHALLTDSVELRLRADVPVGSCLSGGLDSSSIVCVLSDLLKQRDAGELQKTF